MDSTTNGRIRRRVTAAITSALATATVLAALVVALPTPVAAPGRRPTPSARSCSAPAASPPGGIPGATAAGHLNLSNRGQVVGFNLDAQGVFRSFVKDREGRVMTFSVPAPRSPWPGASTTAARSSCPNRVTAWQRDDLTDRIHARVSLAPSLTTKDL